MTSDLEDQVVDVHLLLLLHDVDDETVNVVPLPLQSAGGVLVDVQVRLSGQQPDGRGDALQTAGRHLPVQLQHTCEQTERAESERKRTKDSGVSACGECLTPARLIGLAADQRSSLADERQQSVKQHGGRQAGFLLQSVHSNLLQRRTESRLSANASGDTFRK